jgi:hypothetical protein
MQSAIQQQIGMQTEFHHVNKLVLGSANSNGGINQRLCNWLGLCHACNKDCKSFSEEVRVWSGTGVHRLSFIVFC